MFFSNINVDYKHIGLPEALVRALDYLKNTDLKAMEAGSYELEADRKMYVNIDVVDTRLWKDTKPESHKDYIDVQFMIDGEEDQGAFSLKGTEVPAESHADRDLYFYDNSREDEAEVQLTPGNYTIFFPTDAHRPLIAVNKPIQIKKAVVKVHISLLK